ncbi:MAG: hypothetical protein ACLGI9_12095 [Thermoanaerobaculia bacterium]
MGTIQLLLGRHGPNDHYLGGRYYHPDRPRRPQTLAFPLSERTIHLYEYILPSQLRDPVPARWMFGSFSSRYDRTALQFALEVEEAGGKSYNAESRPDPDSDRHYAELHETAERADLAFFKRPTYARYLELAQAEERFGALRESLVEANLEHFASGGFDVVARLGRIHSSVQRLARRGFDVRTRIGAGSFFPEQILKRRAIFGLEVREEDRMRAYIDRLLRIVPLWSPRLKLPSHEFLLSLRDDRLAAVRERFEAAVALSRSLPAARDLLAVLVEVAGYQPETGRGQRDPRFARLLSLSDNPRGGST